MTDLVFKRVLHPIGQVAFFSEQFYSEDKETLLYNVVYDSGSMSSGIRR